MGLFRRKPKLPVFVERRNGSPENTARRKVFDEHASKVVQMKTAHVESETAKSSERIAAIEANLRAIRRRGISQKGVPQKGA